MTREVMPSGPQDAKIMIVGEAPGEWEEQKGQPFVGPSGNELTRMLHEAGIQRTVCFLTNVARVRPPKNDIGNFIALKKKDVTRAHVPLRDKMVTREVREGYDLLVREINLVKPNLIIALGNTSMWALTGKWGVTDWRGSELWCDQIKFEDGTSPTVIPTYHPAAVLRQWSWRPTCIHDLKKAARMLESRKRDRPIYNFIIRPNYQIASRWLESLLERPTPIELSVDIETRAGHIACIGFAPDAVSAICIPLMAVERDEGYWTEEEEVQIILLIRKILTHPDIRIIGQNFAYDAQYLARHWCFQAVAAFDTMLAQHAAFPNLPKDLGFLSSIYCSHHIFWKNDGKTWDKSTGEEQLWRYNCEDCVRTFEIAQALKSLHHMLGTQSVNDFQQSLFGPVLRTMLRGVRIDKERRKRIALELSDAIAEREKWLNEVFGHELNVRSPKQMYETFVDELGVKPILKRRSNGAYTPSFDDECLEKMAAKEPLLRAIVKVIADVRSLNVFFATFVQAPLDHDGRMRCMYKIGGTIEYRFSSEENAFGSGTNLQNIPKGDEG